MADHFALMAGRLLTESTLQSAVQEALAVASVKIVHDQPDLPVHEDVQDGKAKSGVMVECRICQEEGDESYMETPCCCKGSLKASTHTTHASKGGAMRRETQYARYAYRRSGERSDNIDTDRSQEHFAQTSDQAAGTSSFDSQNSSPKGVFYCRVVAISLMALLVLRDAISLILGDPEVYSIALFTATSGLLPHCFIDTGNICQNLK
ncbi:Os01g0686700 [Oryza sativa Japonica Group]|uniref:Os01g0686700 protein n=1 Tax=Oryza sativa subsp. japonica TaxID=39947 RepID=C7IW94_ORYSJ|nr:Os01g0686700 [Oryza sativa Japonica Group]|eukprot:NP_001172511.1 Os01g0686700 [Oryza sativa Japonica Group]